MHQIYTTERKKRESDLSHQELISTLSYNEKTGIFVWLKTNSRIRKAGDIAGSKNLGYTIITINKRSYPAHRLAWFYVNKQWPPKFIDHINGSRSDNRIDNLRLASEAENCMNVKGNKSNTSGFIGVSWSERSHAWRATLRHERKNIHIGFFSKKEDAMLASCYYRIKLFGDFASEKVKHEYLLLSKGIDDVESYINSSKGKEKRKQRKRNGAVFTIKLKKKGVVYEASTPDGLSLGRFDDKERARISVSIYSYFLNSGYQNIPRTISTIIE